MAALRFRPEIFDDLRVASDWYDERGAGLGKQFEAEFWSLLDKIQVQPLAYAVSEIGLRAARLSRFPYIVFYRLDERELLIVAVMHGARNQSGLLGRL